MTLKVKQHFVSARMRKSRNPNRAQTCIKMHRKVSFVFFRVHVDFLILPCFSEPLISTKIKKPWQSFDININIIYNILYVSESYKQRTFGKTKDREEEALGSLEEWYMAMDAEVHLTFIIRNGKYPAITREQVTTQLTEGGVG